MLNRSLETTQTISKEMFLESGVNVSLYDRLDPFLAGAVRLFLDQVDAPNGSGS
jgi:hypothetical protein